MMKNWSKDRQVWSSNFSEVGKVWTKFGLSMGKAVMQGSADALRKTAEVLDQVSSMMTTESEENQSSQSSEKDNPASPNQN